MIRPFIRDVHGAFVVFDLTDLQTFNSIVEWIEELHQYGSQELSIILVGSKSDLIIQRQITHDQAMTFASQFNFQYVETSALNGSNVEQMFISLITNIYHKTVQVKDTPLSLPIVMTNVLPSSFNSQQVSIDKTKSSCDICASKESVTIMLCHGCAQHFCQKHFYEHRDKLKTDLKKIINEHDEILQDFHMSLNHASNSLDNDNARALLKQIDEWQTRTIDACCRTADETRGIIARLFKQQQSEKFIENDLERLKQKVEQFKNDTIQLITSSETIIIQTQSIDWRKVFNISRPSNIDQIINHYVLVIGEIGAGICPHGKSTIIDYTANFFANNRTFRNRILRTTINPSYALITTNMDSYVQATMANYYRFPIDDQENIVFIDTINFSNNDTILNNDIPIDLLDIDQFAAIILVIDAKNFDQKYLSNEIKKYIDDMYSSTIEAFQQLFVVVTHCKSCTLEFDLSKFVLPVNITIFGMENSAYSSDEQLQTRARIEDDFLASMQTIEQIVNKILNGTDQYNSTM
ncbi:unnamed protein product [Rotaria sp. Silwood2]|nr:unnamed protein product [Rotaria sp. Silwood2]CAF3053129.1 unnamed protein product [Rotaria sp. Silwood2]CAF4355361.1 unnamed protein product [Rotaria sp. Silwood2]CAF4355377.1 unnamed protein product [Rotaria sp. Silwood2]